MRNTKYRPKTWQLQAEAHTRWRKCGCGGEADIRPRRPATHQILREMGLSQSFGVVIIRRNFCLKCLKRYRVQELSEATRHAFIKPDLWSPNSHDLKIQLSTSGAYFSNESTTQKWRMWMIWGSVWLMCGMKWNRALLTTPLHDHWRRRIYACLRVRRGHFEYSQWQINQNFVSCKNCNAWTV